MKRFTKHYNYATVYLKKMKIVFIKERKKPTCCFLFQHKLYILCCLPDSQQQFSNGQMSHGRFSKDVTTTSFP